MISVPKLSYEKQKFSSFDALRLRTKYNVKAAGTSEKMVTQFKNIR